MLPEAGGCKEAGSPVIVQAVVLLVAVSPAPMLIITNEPLRIQDTMAVGVLVQPVNVPVNVPLAMPNTGAACW